MFPRRMYRSTASDFQSPPVMIAVREAPLWEAWFANPARRVVRAPGAGWGLSAEPDEGEG